MADRSDKYSKHVQPGVTDKSNPAVDRALIAREQLLNRTTKAYNEAREAQKKFMSEGADPVSKTVALFGRMTKQIKQVAKDYRSLGKDFNKIQQKTVDSYEEQVQLEEELISLKKIYKSYQKDEFKSANDFNKALKSNLHQQEDIGKQLKEARKIHKHHNKELNEHLVAVKKYGSRWGMIKKSVAGVALLAGTVLLAAFAKAFEVVKKGYDAWRAFYWKFQLDLVHAGQTLRDQIGPNSAMMKGMKSLAGMSFWKGWGMEEAANVAAKLAENMDMAQLTEDGAKQWIKTGILASKGLGMGAEAAGDFVGRLHKGWQMSHQDITEYLLDIREAAKETGTSSVLMAKDIQDTLDVWTKYGDNFQEMAIASARQARQYGVSLKELLAVSDKFSTFESSAENVGKLNAVLGTNLNTAKMLLATESERADILREQLQKSGKYWQNMSRFEKEAVINMTGWNAETAQAVLSTGKQHKSLKELEKEEAKRARQKRSDAKLQKDANKAMKEMAHILDEYFGPEGKLKRAWEKFGEIFEPVRKTLDDFYLKTLKRLTQKFDDWAKSGKLHDWVDNLSSILDEKLLPALEKAMDWILIPDKQGLDGLDKALMLFEKIANVLLEIKGYALSFRLVGKVMIGSFLAVNTVLQDISKTATYIINQAKIGFGLMSGKLSYKEAAEQTVELSKNFQSKGSSTGDLLKSYLDDLKEIDQALGGTGRTIVGGQKRGSSKQGASVKNDKVDYADVFGGAQSFMPGSEGQSDATAVLKNAKNATKTSESVNELSEEMAEDASKSAKNTDKFARGIASTRSGIKIMEKYYAAAYKMAKKIASYEDVILEKAASKMKQMNDTVLSPATQMSMASAMETASVDPSKYSGTKIGDISIMVSDVILDGEKLGKVVWTATKKS